MISPNRLLERPAFLGGSPMFAQPIPFVRPVLPPASELEGEVREILETGMLTKGPRLARFESAVAKHLGVEHAVGVSSCTTGLMLTYRGLGLEGDVVVPSFTFMATVSAMIWAGLRPVFADVRLGTTNLDPAAAEAAITPRTSAIVAVHNFGNPAEADALQAVATRHGLKLVFDAAHGLGTRYRGVPAGPQGDAHVYSMSPTKLLVTGEGGIVATNDAALAQHVRLGREYGNNGSYDSAFAGINARLGELNALLGLHGLEILEPVARYRNEFAATYRARLAQVPGLSFVEVHADDRSSYKDFSIVVDPDALGVDRDLLAVALSAEGIDTRKYYDPPVHRHTAYRQFAPCGEALPNTDLLADRSLSLPMGAHLGHQKISQVCDAIERIHQFSDQVCERLHGDGESEPYRRRRPFSRPPARTLEPACSAAMAEASKAST